MALDQRIFQNLRVLDQRILDNSLTGCLENFILSCQVENLSPATIHYYRQRLIWFFNFCRELGVTSPADVEPQHIRLYLLYCQKRNKSVTAGINFRAVKRFFNWLVAEGILKDTPVKNIKAPKVPDTIIKPFTLDELKRMFLVCENNYCGIRNRAMLLVFLDTGLRLREMANIKLEDVTANGLVKVMGKGAKERLVRLSPPTLKAVLAYRKAIAKKGFQSEYLWVGEEGKPLNSWGITSVIRRICWRAGIKGFTEAKCGAHTFRHTFATMYIQNGGDLGSLQTLLGHASTIMTRRYSRTGLIDQAMTVHQKASPVSKLGVLT